MKFYLNKPIKDSEGRTVGDVNSKGYVLCNSMVLGRLGKHNCIEDRWGNVTGYVKDDGTVMSKFGIEFGKMSD